VKFSQNSLSKLITVEKVLQDAFNQAIDLTKIDFGISHGKRTADEQFELFKKGREYRNGEFYIVNKDEVVTYLDGFSKKSMHQYGRAVDIFCYVNGKVTWEPEYYYYVAGLISVIDPFIKWGGFWKWKDLPHFEI